MPELVADRALVARCGLYCGACRSYLGGRCPGCAGNQRAGWCKVRSCCAEHGYASCADCQQFTDPGACRKHTSVVSTLIGLVLNSDRRACVQRIRAIGPEAYAEEMAAAGRQTIPRR